MSLTLSPETEAAAPLVVNKRELARFLGISMPTLSARLDAYDDFPVIAEGTNGVEWQFDPRAVREFLARKEVEAAEREAARNIALSNQMALPIGDLIAPAGAAALTPQSRLAHARALTAERELARDSGLLVPTSDVRLVLNAAFGLLNRSLDSIVLELARELQLPTARVRKLQERMADAKTAFRRELRAMADAERAAAEPDLLTEVAA